MPEKPFRVGSKVTVRVARIDPAGVMVRLPDDSQGVIRRKELTWDQLLQDRSQIVRVGEEIEVLVLSFNQPSELWDLSLRQAQGDPWTRLKGRLKKGDRVRGWVVSVFEDRAYVQVIPGVDALVPGDEVPLEAQQSIKDVLWIGDKVVGVVRAFDPEKERLVLSLSDYLDQIREIKSEVRDQAEARRRVADTLPTEDVSEREGDSPEPDAEREVWIAPGGARTIQRILVIDDEEAFHKPFCGWLRDKGYEAEPVESAPEAVDRAISDTDLNLVFGDARLEDGDGLQVARQILAARPSLPVVIVTGLDWFKQDLDLKDMQVVDLLLKPPDFDEVEMLLEGVASGRWVRRQPLARFGSARKTLIRRASAEADLRWKGWEQSVQAILDGLLASTGATGILLFDMDPVNPQVMVEAEAGTIERQPFYDWSQARYSPIRNVIQDGEEILEDDAQHYTSKDRFDNLLSLLSFSSCVAVPVLTPGRPTRYGLFLFHFVPQHFMEDHLAQARLAAQSLMLAVEQREFAESVAAIQEFVIAGQLGTGLVHELGNRMTGLEQCARNLPALVDGLSVEMKPSQAELSKLQAYTGGLAQISQELRELVHFYLGLIRPKGGEHLEINHILTELEERMRREARDHNVKILLELASDMPAIWSVKARLQQSFINVMLNAIQQIGSYNPNGGLLVVSTKYDGHDNPRPVKITFDDDGPGIHYQMRERIFERGTTTREEGAGLGLFISRSLVQSLGGKIRVAGSTLFVGSSFLIELPVLSDEGAAS
ncbi:S1 RNA-binding domain-containing protein [Chloroflexota bacterium]